MTNEKRWKLLSDSDGHYYLVPVGSEKDFNSWVNAFLKDCDCEDDCNCDYPDPDGYESFGAILLGRSPTCISFTNPREDK